MIKLRSDGKLETDSPVVLSCFLGEDIEVHTYDLSIHRGALEYVSEDHCGIEVGGDVGNYYFEDGGDSPIIISASVIAEVTGIHEASGTISQNIALYIIDTLTQGEHSHPLYGWLRTHT